MPGIWSIDFWAEKDSGLWFPDDPFSKLEFPLSLPLSIASFIEINSSLHGPAKFDFPAVFGSFYGTGIPLRLSGRQAICFFMAQKLINRHPFFSSVWTKQKAHERNSRGLFVRWKGLEPPVYGFAGARKQFLSILNFMNNCCFIRFKVVFMFTIRCIFCIVCT